jgi:hypothetical protein
MKKTPLLSAFLFAVAVAVAGIALPATADLYPIPVLTQQKAQGAAGVPPADMGYISYLVEHAVTPPTVSATGVHAAISLTAAAQTVSTGFSQPSMAMAVSVKGNTSGITGNVAITGWNLAKETITDTIALNGTSTVAGTKAFRRITSIALPARTHVGDTVSIGTTKVIGLPYKLSGTWRLIKVNLGGTDDESPTITASATALESNTVTPSGTPDGAKVLTTVMFIRKE